MPFATFRSSALKDISSTTMYILRPEIDITLLRDAISESRTGILKLWDRRGFAYCYHKFSRGAARRFYILFPQISACAGPGSPDVLFF